MIPRIFPFFPLNKQRKVGKVLTIPHYETSNDGSIICGRVKATYLSSLSVCTRDCLTVSVLVSLLSALFFGEVGHARVEVLFGKSGIELERFLSERRMSK
ncbi:hypothetical protein CEXT_219891 [Caerostris extrusa]|uniref:Uncharacterized protein n=1 Tax=Caerostris extrusa TaxID=172846 RepID=A0AAV4NW41_CAEEX|nr:hypothetical protein CEXT_219891 [Caerostris extrusa]